MQDESDGHIESCRVDISFALLVGHSRSKARFDYWDSRRDSASQYLARMHPELISPI